MFGWGCGGLFICLLAQLEEHLLLTLLLVQLILQGLKQKGTHATRDVFGTVLDLQTLSSPISQAGHSGEAIPSSVASACPATPSCAGCGSHPGT